MKTIFNKNIKPIKLGFINNSPIVCLPFSVLQFHTNSISNFNNNKILKIDDINNNKILDIGKVKNSFIGDIIDPNKDKEIKFLHKMSYIKISYLEFTESKFIEVLVKNLNLRSTYSLIFKYNHYFTGTDYMLNHQWGIVVKDFHDINYYRDLFESFEESLNKLLEKYSLNYYPDFIILNIKEIYIDEILTLDNIKNIKLYKGTTNITETLNNFNNKLLPLTLDYKYFGSLLEGALKIEYLTVLINKLSNNKLDLFNKTELLPCNFYLDLENYLITENNQITFLEYVKYSEDIKLFLNKDKYLLISIFSNNNYIRILFNINTGKKILFIKDVLNNEDNLLLSKNNKNWIRKVGSTSLIINNNNNKIIGFIKNLNLKAIEYKDYSKYLKTNLNKTVKISDNPTMVNRNFGTFDIESFIDIDSNGNKYSRIFALGFMTNIDKNPKLFYLTDNFTSDNPYHSNLLLLDCIDSMLISKYKNFIFYVHNLGKYDVIFLQKILINYNETVECKYILKPYYKDNIIIKLVVKLFKTDIKIIFIDSLNILNTNLDKLCKDYEIGDTKGIFPYSFVNKNNLNYVGNTPNISYYNNLDLSFYNSIYKNNWSLKQETLTYLSTDLISLLKILNKCQSDLFIDHYIDMTESLTIASLAKNKFFKYYLKDSKIPLINNSVLFNYIYNAYYGGITEVYRPYGRYLKCFDFNSLYPSVALNPMPGIKAYYIESFDEKGLDINKIFGVFEAEVITNNLYLGLLPIKTKNGLIFPNGIIKSTWTSIELQFAYKHGYKIKVIRGYQFNKIYHVFDEYIKELSAKKDLLKGSKRQINKSLLNNLIGRFGLNFIKPKTKLVNNKKLDYILSTRKIKSYNQINDNNTLITFYPLIDPVICEKFNLDYHKVILNESNSDLTGNVDLLSDISIIIAAFVTAYGRIKMQEIKLKVLALGGKIYYSDTDSIITDIDLAKLFPDLVGNKLGLLKFEYDIKEGYFITNKTYALVLTNGKIIIKAKGIDSNSLNIKDFETMYLNSRNVSANKLFSKTNYNKGYVIIDNKKVLINFDSYKKREKIINSLTNLWEDTKPLYINNIETNIILYSPKPLIIYKNK